MSFVMTPQGNRLSYRFDGDEHLPPLVLLNSIATHMEIWDPLVAALSGTFRVLRFDARGQGQSSAPPGPYSIESLAADLLHLLDAFEINNAALCGVSLGAMVAMHVATHHPNRVSELVLCNTAAYVGPPEAWDARVAGARKDGMVALRPAVMQRWLSLAFVETNGTVAEAISSMAVESSLEGYAGACAAIRDMDQRESIRAINVPTLVVAGRYDMATSPQDAKELAERIHDARYTELPCGHLAHVEVPDALARTISEFLSA